MPLLEFTPQGIYCPQADVYIDPSRKVSKALITHGHSDHARKGMGQYLCTDLAKPTLQHRLGESARISTLTYGECVTINGVSVSFHPAGHIIGSAQIRLEYKGEIAVLSGDYKLEDDNLSTAFESIPCHIFVTETTFGLPLYHWPEQAEVYGDINQWWQDNRDLGKVSILMGYSLGKSQRILHHLDPSIGPIYCHSSIEAVNELIRAQGIPLQSSRSVEYHLNREDLKGAVIITPPGSLRGDWLDILEPYATAACSGWTMLRKGGFGPKADRNFILSDHADWGGLNRAVEASGAELVYATHGYTEAFSRWLQERGIDSKIIA